MKLATIYERKGKVYVHSSSRTTAGIWIINAPVLAVDASDMAGVGSAVRRCLAASREGVPHPQSFERLFDPVLILAGVKSFNTFVKSAKCVEAEARDDASLTLTPTRNEGVDGGFAPLPNTTEAGLDSDEAVGAAVTVALSLCK
jgi:hypothetical protein